MVKASFQAAHPMLEGMTSESATNTSVWGVGTDSNDLGVVAAWQRIKIWSTPRSSLRCVRCDMKSSTVTAVPSIVVGGQVWKQEV